MSHNISFYASIEAQQAFLFHTLLIKANLLPKIAFVSTDSHNSTLTTIVTK